MTAPKCTSFWGHRFEARYSTRPQNLSPNQISEMFWISMSDRTRLTSPHRTYECDVCMRCGHVVQKADKV